jgi:hypothetical protein
MRKFIRALKKDYGTPERVLARLGYDRSILHANDESLEQEKQTLFRRGMAVADIQRLIDTHVAVSDPRGGGGGEVVGSDDVPIDPMIRGEKSYDDLPPKIESMTENLSAGDDEPDALEPFRQHLREHSDMTEDEISRACSLARDHLRRRGSNGRDRGVGKNRFPLRSHSGPIADRGAMDAASTAKFKARYPGLLGRIQVEPEARRLSSDRRLTTDAVRTPTAARIQKISARYPGLSAIRSMSDVAHVGAEPAPSGRSRFEV